MLTARYNATMRSRAGGPQPPVPTQDEMRGGLGSDRTGQYCRASDYKRGEGGWTYLDDDVARSCPDRDLLLELYQRAEEIAQRE